MHEEFPVLLSDFNQAESRNSDDLSCTGEAYEDIHFTQNSELFNEENASNDLNSPRQDELDYEASVLSDLLNEIREGTDADTTETLDHQQPTTKRSAPVHTSLAVVGTGIRNRSEVREQVFNGDGLSTEIGTSAPVTHLLQVSSSGSDHRICGVSNAVNSTSRIRGASNAVNYAPRIRGASKCVNLAPRISGASKRVNYAPRTRGPSNGVIGVPRLRGSSRHGRIEPISNIQQFFNDYDEEEEEFQNDRPGSIRENASVSTVALTTTDAPVVRVDRDRSNLRHVSFIVFNLNQDKLLSSYVFHTYSLLQNFLKLSYRSFNTISVFLA